MSRALAIDACAALHAKQMGALEVLGRFVLRGVSPLFTKKVYGEALDMTLRAWLDEQNVTGRNVARALTNAARNHCDPRNMPGKEDLEVVALAAAEDALVLTHDGPAADTARRMGLLVVDLVDVIAFAYRRGWVDEPELAAFSQRLDRHAWRAPDWKGEVLRTIEARPRFDRTAAALEALLD